MLIFYVVIDMVVKNVSDFWVFQDLLLLIIEFVMIKQSDLIYSLSTLDQSLNVIEENQVSSLVNPAVVD